MAEQTRTRTTVADYYRLPETHLQRQLIEGEVIEMNPPIPAHQQIVVAAILLLAEKTKTFGGIVYTSPIEVYFDDDNIPQPDVLWLAPDTSCKVTETRLEGAPDLIVEVLSPSTARFDKREKFKLYQRYGVREYWIVDAAAKFIEVYVLRDGKFVQQGIYAPTETFESALVGTVAVSVLLES